MIIKLGKVVSYHKGLPPIKSYNPSSKLVSAIFFQISIFSPNDSPSKTVKMFFISSKKLFPFSRHSNFYNFPLSTLSRFKRTNGSVLIYDVMN